MTVADYTGSVNVGSCGRVAHGRRTEIGRKTQRFVGLGLQAPVISWGVLLGEAETIRVLGSRCGSCSRAAMSW